MKTDVGAMIPNFEGFIKSNRRGGSACKRASSPGDRLVIKGQKWDETAESNEPNVDYPVEWWLHLHLGAGASAG
jgi:hypothetical protein